MMEILLLSCYLSDNAGTGNYVAWSLCKQWMENHEIRLNLKLAENP